MVDSTLMTLVIMEFLRKVDREVDLALRHHIEKAILASPELVEHREWVVVFEHLSEAHYESDFRLDEQRKLSWKR
ncbi:MAG: hypothetical protein KDC54_22315 [Lewinella sp.]|nr:hypothetical protein [Lewinella sp.]